MPRTTYILFISAFLRALAISLSGLLLGIYLAEVGFSASTIGAMVTAGLAGGAAATLLTTFFADSFGRKNTLLVITLLTAVMGLLIPFVNEPLLLGIIVFLGMVNGMGRDRGAALVIEQAILPSTTTDDKRTKLFAWYNVLQDSGHAIGALLVGLPVIFTQWFLWSNLTSLQVMFVLYSALFSLSFLLYLLLPKDIESKPSTKTKVQVSADTKNKLWKISSLFALDSIGGGFLTSTLLSYFFFKQFDATAAQIGALYFFARIANAGSHLAAAWLAKRIGLVNTMVFTHIPSSLLLVTVAFAPSFTIAAVLFLIRESLVEMDVPTRQSYVMAIVKPEERTLASGVTHLVRLSAWAIAPIFAGFAMQSISMIAPLITGAGLKITYDFLLYFSFKKVKPPEEV